MNLKPYQVICFENSQKKADNQPSMKGEAKIICPNCQAECDMEVALWAKTTQKNRPFLSGTIKKLEPNQWNQQKKADDAVAKAEREKPVEDISKDLPF